MAQITFDTDDSPVVLRAIAQFANALMADVKMELTATYPPSPEVPDELENTISDIDYPTVEEQSDPDDVALVEYNDQTTPLTRELDSTGRAWDERIDSSVKKFNKDGSWKARRGVAPEEREVVLAEILGNMPPAVTPEPVPASVFDRPPEAPSAESISWPDLLKRLTKATAAKQLDQKGISEWLSANNISSVAALASRPDLFSAFIRDTNI